MQKHNSYIGLTKLFIEGLESVNLIESLFHNSLREWYTRCKDYFDVKRRT